MRAGQEAKVYLRRSRHRDAIYLKRARQSLGMVAAVSDLRNKIIPVLKKNGVKKAALFGSTARGEAKKGSDVDILVQLGRKESLFDVIRLKLALEKKLKKGVDLVEYAAIKPALREYILKDEVPIL